MGNVLLAGAVATLFSYDKWGGNKKSGGTIREITLNQTSLKLLNKSSASSTGIIARKSSAPEMYIGLTHWVLDVGDANSCTRYQLTNEKDGIEIKREFDVPHDEMFAPMFMANKGKTMLSDDEIWEIAKNLVIGNPNYRIWHNDCQTFSVMLFDKIAFEKPWLIGVNGTCYAGQQRLARWLGF